MVIEVERETDGRFIAEAPAIPGAMTYGQSREDAIERLRALVSRLSTDRRDSGEAAQDIDTVILVDA